MHLFHCDAEAGHDEATGGRTWLVVADNLCEALLLVPGSYTVKAVSVQLAAASGSARLIGWMGPSPEISGGAGAKVSPAARLRFGFRRPSLGSPLRDPASGLDRQPI
ncbi:hypothetical protein SAMN06265365_11038 [Tistlia consotensis]|uniref:Uncharacterized protein n=1 Tax=Tistlia consotensis USBA 355 TaxID=560819 RepID=A0A1Y6BVY2_9PROT|nr:hypothetical protein [Tistlia consotensis]SMF27806.1 hypothetical protein SAMN05428998_109118 [Tistlia consotensis USBA 355]SNR65610.1 hypothetical protein SAMN06265365_11038 [Tistlia consotensis]